MLSLETARRGAQAARVGGLRYRTLFKLPLVLEVSRVLCRFLLRRAGRGLGGASRCGASLQMFELPTSFLYLRASGDQAFILAVSGRVTSSCFAQLLGRLWGRFVAVLGDGLAPGILVELLRAASPEDGRVNCRRTGLFDRRVVPRPGGLTGLLGAAACPRSSRARTSAACWCSRSSAPIPAAGSAGAVSLSSRLRAPIRGRVPCRRVRWWRGVRRAASGRRRVRGGRCRGGRG